MEQQQKYRLGTINNIKLPGVDYQWGLIRFYRRLASPSSPVVVHNI